MPGGAIYEFVSSALGCIETDVICPCIILSTEVTNKDNCTNRAPSCVVIESAVWWVTSHIGTHIGKGCGSIPTINLVYKRRTNLSEYTDCLLNGTQLIPGKIKLIVLVLYTYLIHVGTRIRIQWAEKNF